MADPGQRLEAGRSSESTGGEGQANPGEEGRGGQLAAL
jgi:hypothetical protein